MSTPDSVADDQLRAGYERWYRLEEEKAAIGEDLKALFAELKANGFTPKALRESFRRVRNINDASQQEHDAIVDLYVAALTGPRVRDARDAREADVPHDADGVVIEDDETSRHGAGGAEDEAAVATVAATSSAQLITGAPEDAHSPHANVGLAGPAFVEDAPQANIKPATIPQPVEGTTPTSTADGDRGGQVPPPSQPAPVVPSNVVELKKRLTFNDPAHRDCLEPERCGGFSNLGRCQRCREAAEGGQVA